ncbi:MAG: cytochrome c [Firmicutes bacterium]|nr:cytochrome c [Bacillota bacterium]
MKVGKAVGFVVGNLGLLVVLAACGGHPAPSAKGPHPPRTGHRRTESTPRPSGVKDAEKLPGPYSAPPARLPRGNEAAGARVFQATCESCHGRDGVGTGKAPRLKAPSSVVQDFKTETALTSFILHNMPANNPGILTTSKAANAAAYVWHLAHGR